MTTLALNATLWVLFCIGFAFLCYGLWSGGEWLMAKRKVILAEREKERLDKIARVKRQRAIVAKYDRRKNRKSSNYDKAA